MKKPDEKDVIDASDFRSIPAMFVETRHYHGEVPGEIRELLQQTRSIEQTLRELAKPIDS